jgi:hypothetical protein
MVVAVGHMLALSLLNPASITVFWPSTWSSSPSLTATVVHRSLLQMVHHMAELRRIWCMLWCTVASDSCHLIIVFWHVRSTAPSSSSYANLLLRRTADGRYTYYRTTPATVYYAVRSANMGPSGGTTVDAMNEFVLDLHVRLHRAKNEWSKRLDDFTRRLASTSHGGTTGSTSSLPQSPDGRVNNNSFHRERSNGLTPPTTVLPQQQQLAGRGLSVGNNTTSSSSTSLTPFRVLLHLFAYEDVLDNGKLDAVFDQDDGMALTFFVPQLLSFLLHGALFCSPQLEQWILDKCQKNVSVVHWG